MKSNRNAAPQAAPKKRIRRNEDALIAALQAKIETLRARATRKAMKTDPNLAVAAKLVRALKKAEAHFAQNGRLDLANSAKVAAITIERTATPG